MLIATSDYEEVVQVADRAVVMARGRPRQRARGRRDHDEATSHGGGRVRAWSEETRRSPPAVAPAASDPARRVEAILARVPESAALIVVLSGTDHLLLAQVARTSSTPTTSSTS